MHFDYCKTTDIQVQKQSARKAGCNQAMFRYICYNIEVIGIILKVNSLKEEVMHCVLRRIIDQWLPLASRAKYLNFNNENLKRWLSERLCGIIIVGNIIFAGSLVAVVEDVIHYIITTIIFWITNYH